MKCKHKYIKSHVELHFGALGYVDIKYHICHRCLNIKNESITGDIYVALTNSDIIELTESAISMQSNLPAILTGYVAISYTYFQYLKDKDFEELKTNLQKYLLLK